MKRFLLLLAALLVPLSAHAGLGLGLSLGVQGKGVVAVEDLSDRVVMGGGQSNETLLHTHGATAFVNTLNTYWPNTTNYYISGGTSGSAAMEDSANNPLVDPWWIDDGGVAGGDVDRGPAWDTWEAAAEAQLGLGRVIKAYIWDQGESDQAKLHTFGAPYIARYKATLLTIFEAMRDVGGERPVIIMPIGRRGDTAISNPGYQRVREVQQQLAAEYDWIYLAPEKYDLNDDGGAHLADNQYPIYAPRVARKVLEATGTGVPGGVDGPAVLAVSREGTTVTVTLDHDGGTDFTPTTGITGFNYFDGSTLVFDGVTDVAARVSADTVEFELDSEPVGTETFYYFYNVLNDIDNTKILKDNDTIPLPLHAVKITDITIVDDTPVGLSFSDITNSELSTLGTANATVSDFIGTLTASVTTGTAEIRKNSTGSWGSTVNVVDGDTINARNTSSASYNTAVASTITLGSGSDSWSITTRTQDTTPSGLSFLDVTDADVSTQYTADATVTAFDGPINATVDSGTAEIRKNSTGSWGSSVSVSAGDTINARNTSSGSASTAVSSNITLGTVTDNWSITTAGPAYLIDAAEVAVWDIGDSSSYSGSGNTINNIVAAPADGSATSAYNLTKAGSGNFTFVGSAGVDGAYINVTGDASVRFAVSANTTFLNALSKTTGSSDFTIAFDFMFQQNDASQIFFGTQNASTEIGVAGISASTENCTLRQADGSSSDNKGYTNGTLVDGTTYTLIMSHNHATNTTRVKLSGTAVNSQTHTFFTNTTNAARLFAILAGGNTGSPTPADTRFYGGALFNRASDDALDTAIEAYFAAART